MDGRMALCVCRRANDYEDAAWRLVSGWEGGWRGSGCWEGSQQDGWWTYGKEVVEATGQASGGRAGGRMGWVAKGLGRERGVWIGL